MHVAGMPMSAAPKPCSAAGTPGVLDAQACSSMWSGLKQISIIFVSTGARQPPVGVPGDAALGAIDAPVGGVNVGQNYAAGVRLAGQGGLTPELLKGALAVLAACLPDSTGCLVGLKRMKIRATA